MSHLADEIRIPIKFFLALVDGDACPMCLGRLRRQLAAQGFAGVPLIVVAAKPVSEGPAVPKHPEAKPEAKPAPRRSLLGRLLRWMLRKLEG